MDRNDILLPFFGVMLLTLFVWLIMYVRRTSYLLAHRIDLREVDTPDKADRNVPQDVNLASHNLKNLFELPVIFYAVCLYLFVTDSVDRIEYLAAWCFCIFRIVHSAIYCSYNRVEHRFAAYQVSALALWFMVLRAAWQAVWGAA